MILISSIDIDIKYILEYIRKSKPVLNDNYLTALVNKVQDKHPKQTSFTTMRQ